MDNDDMARVFKALGDENRLHIVELISDHGEICACDLLSDLDITQPTLSHHMKLLRDSGLVKARKEGRWMHYSLDEERFSAVEQSMQALR